MPATISSTFDIVVDEAIPAGGGVIITNPGRTFRVISMLCTGTNGSNTSLVRTVSGGTTAVCTLVTGDLNDFPSTITVGNTQFLATDNLRLLVQTQPITRVVIVCGAADPQALVVT